MRKVWRNIPDMGLQELNQKLAFYQCWLPFALPLGNDPVDLQAKSHAPVRNGGAPLLPPRYLYLDVP